MNWELIIYRFLQHTLHWVSSSYRYKKKNTSSPLEHLHHAFHKIPLMWLKTSLNIAYVYTHNAELSVVITQIITFIGALYVPSEAEDSDIGRGNTIIELLTFTFASSFLKLLLEKAALSQYLCTVTEDSWWVLALCINHLVSTLTVRGLLTWKVSV